MDTPTLTRRRFGIAAATTAALGAAGLTIGSENARAQVSGDFSIEGGEFQPSDNVLDELWVTIAGDFQVQLNAQPAEWRVYALVDAKGNPGDWEAVGMTSGSLTSPDDTGSYALRAEITASSHYGAVDVSGGQSKSLSIPVSVLFMAMNDDGDTLATAEAMDTVAVSVDPGGAVSAIGGSGEVHAVDNSSDPTPTIPGDG